MIVALDHHKQLARDAPQPLVQADHFVDIREDLQESVRESALTRTRRPVENEDAASAHLFVAHKIPYPSAPMRVILECQTRDRMKTQPYWDLMLIACQ